MKNCSKSLKPAHRLNFGGGVLLKVLISGVFGCFDWKNKNKFKREKAAFTLAEVLITLGIIGVIAAMTIPALMTNMRHKIASARLKKFYSTTKQMFLLSEDENGSVNSWNNNLSYSDFYDTYFIPYIKAEKGKTYKTNDSLFFPDGSSLIIITRKGCLDVDYDYNGKSAPNKSGYDRFRFLFCSEGDSNYNHYNCDGGFCGYYWGLNERQRTRDNLLAKCRLNGAYCSGLLQIDHWEFLPDYPY